jgi:hypothetical protein
VGETWNSIPSGALALEEEKAKHAIIYQAMGYGLTIAHGYSHGLDGTCLENW